jgi:hypothetical protein
MNPAAYAALMEQVRRADALRERTDARNHEPRADSLAAGDAAIPHARFVRLVADVAMAVAADHLLTWQLVVTRGVIPIYAPMTLLRSAVESAVKVRWVVDNRIAGPRRVGRGVAAQVEDYDERRKFEVSVKAGPRPPGAGKSAADRLADLVADRDRDGVPIEHVPSYTDLTRDYGVPSRSDTQWLYRLMSAFAHGTPGPSTGRTWALA